MWFHVGIALTARLLLICYAEIQDKVSEVQYTDVDYRVFTDAARHVLKNESPFSRYTYRYTPLLAYMLTPNLFFHPAWGKLLFSVIDIFVAVLIKKIILLHYKSRTVSEDFAEKCALFWLYNPLTVVISTRGNSDSLAAALVILSLLFLKKENYLLAGAIHGVAIHTRLYPIAFSLAMYSSIPLNKRKNSNIHMLARYLAPNYNRLRLVFGCLLTLTSLTFLFYKLYGYEFLDESLLFHLRRRDIRHNFSVYFYHQYLSFFYSTAAYHRVLTVAPQLALLLALSLVYGSGRDILFCTLCQTVVIVSYNSVLTCQYFVWFLSLLPLCLPDIKLSKLQYAVLGSLWMAAQLAWLLPAYWLEFRGRNTFLYVWLQGVTFFCANMAVLARLIRSYKPRSKEE